MLLLITGCPEEACNTHHINSGYLNQGQNNSVRMKEPCTNTNCNPMYMLGTLLKLYHSREHIMELIKERLTLTPSFYDSMEPTSYTSDCYNTSFLRVMALDNKS